MLSWIEEYRGERNEEQERGVKGTKLEAASRKTLVVINGLDEGEWEANRRDEGESILGAVAHGVADGREVVGDRDYPFDEAVVWPDAAQHQQLGAATGTC
ncbi:hypothetical protein AMTR_s00028p00205510 [Amborella trichopoda]|uniref:Uncharacterized protein n=1 Tax=Amborella trichopoda TaxID=13333 RepID=W1PS28_AMBTC|nr:hypothetical protein AMTR_s00028p00205510 [Amborella trichopoda]